MSNQVSVKQFRNAGPMVLRDPTQEDFDELRKCVSSTVKTMVRAGSKRAKSQAQIKYIAFFRVDTEDGPALHVYAQAHNKLSVAMWRQYVHSRLQDITPIEGSFRQALSEACAGSQKPAGFEEYKANEGVHVQQESDAVNTGEALPEVAKDVHTDPRWVARQAFFRMQNVLNWYDKISRFSDKRMSSPAASTKSSLEAGLA